MKLVIAAFAAALLVPLAAEAAEVGGFGWEAQQAGALDSRVETLSDNQLTGIVGGGFGAAPEYIGSADYRPVFLPLIDLEWRGAYFLSTQRGLGLNFIRRRTVRAGPRLTLDPGRDSSDNSFLTGLADINPSIEAGVFFEGFSGAWRLKGDFREGLQGSGHNGLVGTIDLGLGGRLDERTNLILGGTVHWTGSTYAQAVFGVPAAQATGSRAAFNGTSGFTDVGVYANMVYNVNQRVFQTGLARVTALVGSAADSPLSQSDQQYFAGALIAYRF